MNTFQFFNDNFGRLLTSQTNVPHRDAWRTLSSTHPLQKKNKNGEDQSGRLVAGWVIIRPTGAVMQQKLAVAGIQYDDRTRFEAFGDELDAWDGSPRMFLMFDKAPIPIASLFMTLDLRAVRICSPAGTETFDYTKPCPPSAGVVQRNLDKRRRNNAA
ncbi:MAG: hypothetical protein WD767_08715 [Alphaproteobacteria bacterium]